MGGEDKVECGIVENNSKTKANTNWKEIVSSVCK
jgi:hypothetical protein